MNKMIRFGILSTANIAKKALIPAIQQACNAEVLAVSSLSGKAEKVAEQFNIPKWYNNYDEILEDPEIEAVYIPLPNTLHKEWVIKAAQKGKHVLCEKPAAISLEDTVEMVQACAENNVTFMEAFMYQFHPQHNRVKQLIKKGTIGEVKLIRSNFSFEFDIEKNQQNIRLNSDLGGGSIFDVGCYCIHTSRFILDMEPTEVLVKGHIHPQFGVDTSASGILTFENGISAHFECSFERPMTTVYEVIGSKGSIKVPRAYRPDKDGGVGVIRITNENDEVLEETVMGDQYKLQIEHFANSVLEGTVPSYTPEKTIANMKAILACHQSLKTQKSVLV